MGGGAPGKIWGGGSQEGGALRAAWGLQPSCVGRRNEHLISMH